MSDKKPAVTIHCVLTPDDDEAAPYVREGTDLDSFLPELFKLMRETGKGWVHIWLNGERLKLSTLRTSFTLQAPNGTVYDVAPHEAPVFNDDGLFEFKI